MIESLEIFSLPFVRNALLAGLTIAGVASYLGVFVVLRRIVFVSIALAQLAAVGVALSFFLPFPPEALALVVTLLGALVMSTQLGGRSIPREAGIGFVYATSAAVSILVVAKSAQGESHVLGLLFGNVLTLTARDLILLLSVAAVVLGIHTLFHKEFLFSSFDPETARSAGFRVGRWNALFDLTLAGAIAVAIHAAGALLVFSYLVQPAMVGLLLARRLRAVLVISVGSALLATVLGLVISVLLDLPTGPTVIVLSSAMVLLAHIGYRFGLGRHD